MNRRSGAYWARRSLQRLTEIERQSETYFDQIVRLHQLGRDTIQNDMLRIFGTYVKNSGLDPEEAAKMLTLKQSKELRHELRERLTVVEGAKERQRILSMLNAPSYAFRISRLEALQLSVRQVLLLMAEKQIQILEANLKQTAMESYFRTLYDLQNGTGVRFQFEPLSEERIHTTLSERWSGDHFSKRVWRNTAVLAEKAGEVISTNVATGRSWQRCTQDITDLVCTENQGALFAAERLLRTETNHVFNTMTAEAHIQAGFERYRFLATLDNRTSETCQLHDGNIDPDTQKEYTYANKKEGVNYPPLHPFCRSTAAGRFDDWVEAKMLRSAKDPKTGKTYSVPYNMTYEEWKKSLGIKQKRLKKTDDVLQNTLGHKMLSGVIPKGAVLTDVTIIAGRGTKTIIREEADLIATFGGSPGEWEKITANVITNNFRYHIHYYVHNEVQYKVKLKSMKEV